MSYDKQIIMALGSNHNPLQNISHAEVILKQLFPDITFSKRLWTNPIGMTSPQFLNTLAICSTKESLKETLHDIKHIELLCGDTLSQRKEKIVAMDIDILKYGSQKLHENDWNRPYIQQLLKEMKLN